MVKFLYILFLIVLAGLGCKKIYTPAAIAAPNQYLVVEGAINSASDSTFINISRTVNVTSKVTVNPELNALITVEGDQHISYTLTEIGNGIYGCAGLNLDNSHKYRLNIKTTNGNQYLSAWEAVLNSPPIDSVSFDTNGTTSGAGLNIYVNTHNQVNQGRYYRWEYQETWVIHPAFESFYKSNGDTVLQRDLVNDDIYTCWLGDISSNIILGTSAKLSQNVILNSPIISIASTNEKIGAEYSILVKQYVLSADAYRFYVNLKKNTEQLGSIFDAQPSELSGNIHSVTNPSEPVIGYVSVGSTTHQRIFIKKGQLPVLWKHQQFYSGCHIATDEAHLLPCCYFSINYQGLPINQVNEYINYNRNGGYGNLYIPVEKIGHPGGGPPLGYTATTRECADCTIRGTNKKPAFWK